MTDVMNPPPRTTSTAVAEPWPAAPAHGGLYTFDGLSRAQVNENNHGLHKYPAKFIPQLAQWGLDTGRSEERQDVLDPFCGSGTTNLQAALSGHRAVGVDISPLAVLVTRAKTSILDERLDADAVIARVTAQAQSTLGSVERELEPLDGWGLHPSWSHWFRLQETARIVALRDAIRGVAETDALQDFLLACLSSIVKKSSFLSEDQIKVRFDGSKVPADPFLSFAGLATSALATQRTAGRLIGEAAGSSSAFLGSASSLPLADGSIDRVVTSPPYINAIDYTMAHKYNLFALGLIEPDEFKDHCRDYIGMTERAVRAADLVERPDVGDEPYGELVDALWDRGENLTRNRAYVSAQYFSGMKRSFMEMVRVLRPNGVMVMVVGTSNRICGVHVPTGALVEDLATAAGLETELRFRHSLANKSSMRMNRAASGGDVKTETVLVMRRR